MAVPSPSGVTDAAVAERILDYKRVCHRALRTTPGTLSRHFMRFSRHCHALRHARVSLLIVENAGALLSRGSFGHSNARTRMEIFGHLFPEDERVGMSLSTISSRLVATAVPQIGNNSLSSIQNISAAY